jgi:hypothetical protein
MGNFKMKEETNPFIIDSSSPHKFYFINYNILINNSYRRFYN